MDRIEKLREGIKPETYPITTEKLRLFTESMRHTEGEAMILRRAKALANVLENISIFIRDGELIVGNGASRPMGMEFAADYGLFGEDEVESLEESGYFISPEDKEELRSLNEYYRGATLVSTIGNRLWPDEEQRALARAGVVLPPWKNKDEGGGGGYAQGGMGLGPGLFLACIDYERVLHEGLNRLIEESRSELAAAEAGGDEERAEYHQSVVIALEAVVAFAERFSCLAEELAADEEDARRRDELLKIGEICSRVPGNPARTFHEAIQSFWFMFLMLTPSTTAAMGRFDQYMYPFYAADVAEGRISETEAVELLACLRVKDMELNRVAGKVNRQRHSGLAKWHNCTIGGVNADGEDATNELTYLVLEAAKVCPTPHHTITVRVHDGTPDELIHKALEVVRTGIGLPAFVGDDSYIGYFRGLGVPVEEARDYVITGCLDGNLPGSSRTLCVPMFVVPLVLTAFLNDGVDPRSGEALGHLPRPAAGCSTFAEFKDAFADYLRGVMAISAARNNVEMECVAELFPDPVRSPLMQDGVAAGEDFLRRRMPLENGAVMNTVGMINVADSLAAIKKLVFAEQRYSLDELREALENDWGGEAGEAMRREFLDSPKYGNDDDYVDDLAAELYELWSDTARSFETILGGQMLPTAISITSHWAGGSLTAATPDGRHAYEMLADGSMSPMQGRDENGPLDVLKSAMKIDQTPFQATLLNLKFHPSALSGPEDLVKLGTVIRTYFAHGGKHVQFNVVDKETLLDAQAHPERHRDLIVRVAGYSAYFVDLTEAVQDEIIARSEHHSAVTEGSALSGA